MISHVSKWTIILGLFALWFSACTDSDSYLFNNQITEEIQVSAYVTSSFETDAEKSKTDTIQPQDSLIFLTTVQPSKSIRNKQYFWTLDGMPFANEYSFKKNIDIPGEHKVAFVFVDFFGDTLSDTLSITVASPPLLDTEHFIPAAGTQNIAPDTAINFAWNAADPDSLWDVFFHFVLLDSEQDTLADTILQKAYFTNLKKLEPLQKYTWTVSAFNEFNQKSSETLTSSFFTNGFNGENAVAGTIGTSSDQGFYKFNIVLLDSLQDTLKTFVSTESQSTHFSFKPLAKGKYSIRVSIDQASDFIPQTIPFELNASQILELDSITLLDATSPKIQSLTGSDSLDISDTLRFIVSDNGGEISPSRIKIQFENENITTFTWSNDTLYVPFEKEASAQTWSYKLIRLSVFDASYNQAKKIFYLCPNTAFWEVFDD